MSTRCLTPFYKKDEIKQEYMALPCGKCPACLKRRASGWSFRLVKEEERNNSALFVTLTYDTEHVPITRNGFMNLDKTDLQKFFKRLRKRCYEKVRYYAVGEYGSKTQRPHYHIILFNATPLAVENSWKINDIPIGSIHIGHVTEASIGYTLKYMEKQRIIPMHRNDDRNKEFSVMSKGIGENYLTEKITRWHKNDLDNRMYLPLKDGRKIAMPRYYKDKLYNENERKRIAFFQKFMAEELLRKEQAEHGYDYEKIMVERTQEKFRRMYKSAHTNRT